MIVHGHFETIKSRVMARCYEDVIDERTVDLVFDNYGLAHICKERHGREMKAAYPGMNVRFKWRVWNNKPECQIAQVAIQNRMENWSAEKFVIEQSQARQACQCYSCKGDTEQ